MIKKKNVIKRILEQVVEIIPLYLFIVGNTYILLSIIFKDITDFYLAIYNYILLLLILISNRYFEKQIDNSTRIINYIDIYRKIPSDIEKKDFRKREKEFIKEFIKSRLVIKSHHDVLSFIATHPGTILAVFFEKNIDTFNLCYFKRNILIIVGDSEISRYRKIK